MKIVNKHILMILILIMLVTLAACGGKEESTKVITDKSKISLALEPVRQALPRVFELQSGTITEEFDGPNPWVKGETTFEKNADGKYLISVKTTNKDGSEDKGSTPDAEKITISYYPTNEFLEDRSSHATKLTINKKDNGTEYRLDSEYEPIKIPAGDIISTDVYSIILIDKNGIITQNVTHFKRQLGTEIIENYTKTILTGYTL